LGYTMRGSRFAQLSAFVEVAEHGSFTKAAAHFGLTTGSLSLTIRALEEALGVRLLNRTTRSVALTEAGERILTRLRPLLDDFATVVDSANAFRDSPVGSLRLTVPPGVETYLIGPMLARFLAEYPEIVIEISIDASMTDIVAGRYDAGIRFGKRIERDMIAVRISDEIRHLVVASPDYLARHPRPQTPEDLLSHNCIRMRFPSGTFLPWQFTVEGQIVEFEIKGSVIVNEPELLARAALDGIGLLYMVEDYVRPMISAERLIPVLEQWMPPPTDAFFLYYPSRRQNPAPLQALIDFLRASLKTNAKRKKKKALESMEAS
jgi:LysR family transcriptional regulator, regulator of peptidoglycan recycling